MLFNSYAFILLFLPLTVAGYFASARWISPHAARLFLIAASLFFYGWWNPLYLPLLGAVMVFNYWVGLRLLAKPDRRMLAFGIVVDLAVLGWFKYANFLADNINAVAGTHWTLGTIVLPLAISFFTFQKIAYLVDSYRGLTRGYGFVEYTLFVAFFPQLIAGPIVHYRDVLPQFRLPDTYRPWAENFAVGLGIFAIGLAKKTLLADSIAVHADPLFSAAAAGTSPDLFSAWSGALAYALQLYFDFSGYTDMAIGSARLFGIRLPQNFNSPYQARSIIDFWRRWHMTLSRFLRDYLYIALGGNRRGPVRRHANLLATMLLGGLWHGAGWTFVLWGGLHGLYLVINHGWNAIRPRQWAASRAYRALAWGVTLLAVLVAWVPFRAEDLDGTGRILTGMAGLNGVHVPAAVMARLGGLAPLLLNAGVEPVVAGGSSFIAGWLWIAVLLPLALFAPNTQRLFRLFTPVLDSDTMAAAAGLAWRPNLRWAFALALAGCGGLLAVNRVSPFLYFQF